MPSGDGLKPIPHHTQEERALLDKVQKGEGTLGGGEKDKLSLAAYLQPEKYASHAEILALSDRIRDRFKGIFLPEWEASKPKTKKRSGGDDDDDKPPKVNGFVKMTENGYYIPFRLNCASPEEKMRKSTLFYPANTSEPMPWSRVNGREFTFIAIFSLAYYSHSKMGVHPAVYLKFARRVVFLGPVKTADDRRLDEIMKLTGEVIQPEEGDVDSVKSGENGSDKVEEKPEDGQASRPEASQSQPEGQSDAAQGQPETAAAATGQPEVTQGQPEKPAKSRRGKHVVVNSPKGVVEDI